MVKHQLMKLHMEHSVYIESTVMKKFKHPFLIYLRGQFQTQNYLCLFYLVHTFQISFLQPSFYFGALLQRFLCSCPTSIETSGSSILCRRISWSTWASPFPRHSSSWFEAREPLSWCWWASEIGWFRISDFHWLRWISSRFPPFFPNYEIPSFSLFFPYTFPSFISPLAELADTSKEGKELVGTPLYVSPEVLGNEVATKRFLIFITNRVTITDLYIIVFSLLCIT